MIEKLKNVIGAELYDEYIGFIENNMLEHPIKGCTEMHHILPRCCFPEFSDLKQYPWNGVNLSYENHFKAHYILAKSNEPKLVVAFFINNLNKNFNIDDEDYFVNYTKIKQQAVLTNSVGVKKWRNSLSDEEKNSLNNKNSLGVKNFLNSVSDDFFKNRVAKFKETLSKRTEIEKLNIIEKIKETRLNNNNDSYKDASLKAIETMKNTILENSLSIKENTINKMVATRKDSGSYNTGAIKGRNTKLADVDESGLNAYQRSYKKSREKIDTKEVALKAVETMGNTILENGLSIKENRLKKRNETMLKIGKDGLNSYQRAGKKLSERDRSIYYSVQIFDKNDNMIYNNDKITKGELSQTSKLPIKVMWNGDIYKIYKNTRKENKQYEGHYLIKQRIKNEN